MAILYTPGDAVDQGSFPGNLPNRLSSGQGITWDGQQAVIVDGSPDALFTLARNNDGTYTPANAVRQGNLPAGIVKSGGVTWDGQQLVFVDRTGSGLWTLARNNDGTFTPANAVDQGSFPSPFTLPRGVTWDGQQLVIFRSTQLWTLARNNDGTYTPSDIFNQGSTSSDLNAAGGVTWDGFQLLVFDSPGELFTLARNMDGSYAPASATLLGSGPSALVAGTARGLGWDGQQLLILEVNSVGPNPPYTHLWLLIPDSLTPVISGFTFSDDVVDANNSIDLSATITHPDPTVTVTLAWTASPNIGTFSDDDADSTTWTAPGPVDDDRDVVITLTATESSADLTDAASITITVRGNRRPQVTATADQTTVDVGDVVNLTATATDPEGQSMTYSWVSDPGGDFGTPAALTTTWTAPTVTESTTFTLTFTANDSVLTTSTTVTIIVRAPATQPLMLPAIANQSFATGDLVNLTLPEATQGLMPYIYSAAGLPRGLTFRNRAIVGRPDFPGTYTVTYTVTDSNQDMESEEFDIVITGSALPHPVGLNMRIDWGNQFYASSHSDVYSRIIGGIRCFRGKNTASAVLGRSQAGTMSFDLENDDGLYDDENPDSDLAGLIRPGIQVQLRNGVSPLWTGVLDSIPTKIKRGGNNTARVTAHGVLSTAQEATVSGGSLTAESTAQAFIELCVKGDVPYESPQPEPGDAYIMSRWWEVGTLQQALHVLEDTEGGFIFEDREGELGFHLAPYRSERTVSKTFVVGTPSTDDEIEIDGDPRKLTAVKDVHNVVQGNVRQFQTRNDETVYQSEIPIPIALGGRLDLVSVYPVGSGAVSELNSLVDGTDWTANTASDGSGTDRTSRIGVDIELMDFNEVHITIAYGTGSGFDSTLYVRGLTIFGSVLTISTPLQVTREDTVSKQRYRPKTRSLRNTWIRSVADMENRADAILDVLASPERRLELTYLVEDWATFLALDLSDRVHLVLDNLESDAFIESIKLDIRRGGAYYSTLNLSLTESLAAAPAFADDTGDDQDWTQNSAITSITVPVATGHPTPTYAVQGALPAGISFDADTRVISGTPTATGSGTITIRATNSEGTADWTVDYTTTAAAQTIWEQFEALTGALGIRFTGSGSLVPLYEFDPAEGTLLDATSGQHSDTSIYWIERVRVQNSGETLHLHRGGSSVDASTYLSALSDTYTLYLVSETTDTYVALQANDYASAGGGFANWTEATWTVVSSHLNTFADAAAFLDSLADDTVIVGLANDDTWEPYS